MPHSCAVRAACLLPAPEAKLAIRPILTRGFVSVLNDGFVKKFAPCALLTVRTLA